MCVSGGIVGCVARDLLVTAPRAHSLLLGGRNGLMCGPGGMRALMCVSGERDTTGYEPLDRNSLKCVLGGMKALVCVFG